MLNRFHASVAEPCEPQTKRLGAWGWDRLDEPHQCGAIGRLGQTSTIVIALASQRDDLGQDRATSFAFRAILERILKCTQGR